MNFHQTRKHSKFLMEFRINKKFFGLNSMVVTTVPSFRRKNSFQNISIDYFDSFYKTIYNETKKQRQDPSHPYTNLNLSVVAGSEYYERELSDASISNRLGQNIFHTIHSDKDVLQYGF